jgi:hypothetical protein
MLTVFDAKLAAAKQLEPEMVSKALFDFIRSLSKYLIDLNKKQLHEDSQDIYGNAIGFYSQATEIITNGSKKAGEPFDAKDTGGFLDKFYMTVYNDVFYFGSTDPKTDDILDSPNWLSTDLFGLTDENLQAAIETKFKPFIINYYQTRLTA